MERALQLVVELLQVVVAATIGFVVLVMFLSPFIYRPHRPASNESAAIRNLRTINTAQVTYLSYSGGSYGAIADLIAAGLVDDTFTGIKAGYKYSITLDAKGSVYTVEALPVSTNTGRFGYYSVTDAVVRYTTLAPAGQSGRSVQ